MTGYSDGELLAAHLGFESKLSNQSFNGVNAIRTHLDQKNRIQDYLYGNSGEKPDVPMSCHDECIPGKWLHSEKGKGCKNRGLLDSLCNSCEEFQDASAQAVLLANIGEPELALAAIQPGQLFDSASDRFQTNLAELHVELNLAGYFANVL